MDFGRLPAQHQDGAIRVLERPEGEGEETARDVDGELTNHEVLVKFKRFVKEFKHFTGESAQQTLGTLKYRDSFIQNCSAGYHVLELNLGHLGQFEDCDKLRECFLKRPSQVVPICERALKELHDELVGSAAPPEVPAQRPPPMQLQLKVDVDADNSFGTLKPMKLRDLDSMRVERLVVVKGICIRVSKPRHKAHRITLKCTNCENIKEITVPPGYSAAHIPSACEGNLLGGALEKCPPSPWVVVSELCDSHDEQVLKIQELPEDVPVGEMPRSVEATMGQYLAAQCTPGTRLTAIGTFVATEKAAGEKIKSGRSKGTGTIKFSYLHVLGAQIAQGAEGAVADDEEMEKLAKDPQIRDKIYQSIAPAICVSEKDVLEDVKKAVAVMLFGGSRKPLPDGTRMRGDINVLLFGDPGVAKSQFLKFAERVSPVAVFTSGKGSSAAGLTAAITQGPDGFQLEGGAMVLADGGIVCIDEFDKMRPDDRVAIHEAMEQQTISIAKAGITTVLNTRCSVLAAANPTMGSFNDMARSSEQMDFETTILSRFDMMFTVKDVRDEARDYNICKHVIALHQGQAGLSASRGPIDVPELRQYLAYCRRKCSPRLSAEAAEVLQNQYIDIRQRMRRERDAGRTTVPITVRQLEAIIRMSEALAKMELREEAEVPHVEEALRLFTVSTLDTANMDRSMEGMAMSEQQRQDINAAEALIRQRVARGARIGKNALLEWLQQGGQEELVAKQAVAGMIRRRELEERGNFTLQRV